MVTRSALVSTGSHSTASFRVAFVFEFHLFDII